ncbi:MAG: hypothetical protein AADX96_25500, partial [Thiocapsa sp. C3-sup]
MLNDYVVDPSAQERLRRGSAGSHLDGFTDWLAAHQYTDMTIRSYIGAADRFMTWWADVSAGAALPGPDHACLAGYREHLSAVEHPGARTHERGNAYCGARRFLVFLQHTGIIPTMPPAGRPRQELEIRFCSWMLQHRGVCRALCAVSKLLKQQAAPGRDIFVYPGSGGGIDDRSVAYVGGV